ncbi:ANTAR domain-containing response regulator [Streptomyces xantholiticus]|uniref:ANTAR domain-containing response regulator n=1 Tax=Streptomyces xantholiticus TaxID=68285 RepID=UPI00167C2E34|nr:GAF and ANTAR domain-containing protein [Streptomyces xantholiticus]GGW39827.1 ANTAR domain-containing protein [Streptomyces xantholiticus]
MLTPPDLVVDAADTARDLSDFSEAAMRCVETCCGAAITVADGSSERRAAATHPDLTTLLSVELDSGEGPMSSALDTGEPVTAADLLGEERWPDYRAAALDSGIRSSVTMPFSHSEVEVTLSLYSFRPGAFVHLTHHPVLVLGEQFAQQLVRDHHYRAALAQVNQLETALDSRAVIDQASGILMHALGCGPDDAFDVLRRFSQRTNRKLSAVAEEIVRSRGRSLKDQQRAG